MASDKLLKIEPFYRAKPHEDSKTETKLEEQLVTDHPLRPVSLVSLVQVSLFVYCVSGKFF